MGYWFYRWDWGEAIAFDGILSASQALDWSAGLDYVDNELRGWLETSNMRAATAAERFGPCNALLTRRTVVGEADADQLLKSIAEAIAQAPRARSGALLLDCGQNVFVDSLYGDPLFLWRAGEMFRNEELQDAAVALALGHVVNLQDERSGLLRHYLAPDSPSADAPVHWGRGNGWAALGLSDFLSALPPEVAAHAELETRYKHLMSGLVAHQAPGGMWRNIIDEASSYPEASTTALVEAAITQSVEAGNLGPEFKEPADAAWQAIEHRIDTSGQFVGVSYRPGLNVSPARYEHTPAVGLYPWGNGAYLRSATRRLCFTGEQSRPLVPRAS